MSKMRTRKIYPYDSSKDMIRLLCSFAIFVIAIFTIGMTVEKFIDLNQWGKEILTALLFCVVMYPAGFFASICGKMQKKLKISDTEVYYLYGWVFKRKISIPISKVMGCEISTSPLQKIVGLSTISIWTEEREETICFKDIKNGKDAYQTIWKLVQDHASENT
ncbi:MAG: PH domain-containing protein [Clostridia bacterium]|nr:PH domain-containing protein [Clostridia bacterium]